MLYHDDETETFWSQATGQAVVGPLTGEKLKWMPSEVTTWRQWRKKHPETTVLKPPFPAERYATTNGHYRRYRATDRMMFPEGPQAIPDRYGKKDSVTIAFVAGKPRCWPHAELDEGRNPDGATTVVKEGMSVRVLDAQGEEVPSMLAYWYAWCAFYSDGTVYERPSK